MVRKAGARQRLALLAGGNDPPEPLLTGGLPAPVPLALM